VCVCVCVDIRRHRSQSGQPLPSDRMQLVVYIHPSVYTVAFKLTKWFLQ